MHNSQEVANVIKKLAKSRNITIGKMLSDCSLSINTLSSMQSGGYYPRLESIAKIADYLNVSVDYLLGTDKSNIVSKNQTDIDLASLTAALIKSDDEWAKKFVINFLTLSPHEREMFKRLFPDTSGS